MDEQKAYCFPYWENWKEQSCLEKDIDDLPMFFVTNNHGVNFLIKNYGLDYYESNDDCWHLIRNNGNNNFSYMFSDGYEPEDNNLCREWLFLCGLFERLYNEGLKEGKRNCNTIILEGTVVCEEHHNVVCKECIK